MKALRSVQMSNLGAVPNDLVHALSATESASDLIDIATADPLSVFQSWYKDAKAAAPETAGAMTLSTVDAAMKPSARIVMLRSTEGGAFSFATNSQSNKAAHLSQNPFASLTFFWAQHNRQVRIDGAVQEWGTTETDALFTRRRRDAQIGEWTSQGMSAATHSSYADAEAERARIAASFDGVTDIPRPPFWRAYKVIPHSIEFWQGNVGRLHDRVLFTRDNDGWRRERLIA
ncbi:hypothetical protein HDU80_008134 [Chytriomyces hyalinus]|nr:hypothetical protein HDU80_008134 [Chytriomyces hyalinus]